MNRRNYMREMDRIIEKQGDRRPRVLLHVCCGPCSSAVLEYLTRFFELTLLWYNPNIYPEAEFEKRYETLLKLLGDMGLAGQVSVLREEYRSGEYYARVRGFDYFCTTLTLSRHKDAVRINALAEEIAQAAGVKWLPSEFKKRDGENRSIELCEKYNVYRQLYCGCEYSMKSRGI